MKLTSIVINQQLNSLKIEIWWVDRFQVEKQQVDPLSLEPSIDTSNAAPRLPIGWAIHERVQRRFSSKLKELLDTLFEEEERTKNKCTPEHAMTLIRKQLSIDEFVPLQSIKSYFSRKAGKKKTEPADTKDEDTLNDQDDDEQFYEYEMLSATEREATVRGIQHER